MVSLSPAYLAGYLGLSFGTALILSVILFASLSLLMVVALGYLLHHSEEAAKAAILHFPCEFVVLERLIQLIEELKFDATSHGLFSQEMRGRITEMENLNGVFLASAFNEAYTMFLYGVQLLVVNKELQLHGQQRNVEAISPSMENIKPHYPILKAALVHDYAKRRKSRQ